MNDILDIEPPEVEPVDLSDATAVDNLQTVEIDDDAMWIATGEIAETQDWHNPCPNPTKWKLVSQAKAKGRFQIVSPAISAKAGSIEYTFKASRSVTFGASVTAGMKVGIPMLEQEVGLKLETSVTVSTGDSVTFTVPKGRVMALYAGCGYIVRTFRRINYSSFCSRYIQTAQISSPYMKILEVRNV